MTATTVGFTKITPSEANDLMTQDDVLTVDVRPAQMYAQGHIPRAINWPLDHIDAQEASEMLKSKDAPVLLYCQTGVHSLMAAERLKKLGYTHVYDMEGGISRWPFGTVR